MRNQFLSVNRPRRSGAPCTSLSGIGVPRRVVTPAPRARAAPSAANAIEKGANEIWTKGKVQMDRIKERIDH